MSYFPMVQRVQNHTAAEVYVQLFCWSVLSVLSVFFPPDVVLEGLITSLYFSLMRIKNLKMTAKRTGLA